MKRVLLAVVLVVMCGCSWEQQRTTQEVKLKKIVQGFDLEINGRTLHIPDSEIGTEYTIIATKQCCDQPHAMKGGQ